MNFLITSDIHLTDKDREEYKWGLFSWIQEQCTTLEIPYVFILGDITDAKDKHSAKLTNKIADSLALLCSTSAIKEVICLRGNHDAIDPTVPFFRFINNIPKLKFVVHPESIQLDDKKFLLLPNSRDPETDWSELLPTFNSYDYLFMHQTVTGSLAENGTRLTGVPSSLFEEVTARIISGDVHVPQQYGNVLYVGSPYHTRFGDQFEPRVLYIENNDTINMSYPAPKKLKAKISSLSELTNFKCKANDLIKIDLSITDSLDIDKYKEQVKQICNEKGLVWCGTEFTKPAELSMPEIDSKLKNLTPVEVLNKYCHHAKVTERIKEFAGTILTEVR